MAELLKLIELLSQSDTNDATATLRKQISQAMLEQVQYTASVQRLNLILFVMVVILSGFVGYLAYHLRKDEKRLAAAERRLIELAGGLQYEREKHFQAMEVRLNRVETDMVNTTQALREAGMIAGPKVHPADN